MDNNTFYFNRYITQKRGKILRLTELVCCTVCFALAVTVFLIRLYFVTKVILMVISTTFLLITLVDATSWLQSKPMGHRIWVVFSVTAFHMFCLCGGFLVFLKRVTNQRLLQATCAVNFFTAYLYILDCLLIILQYVKWLHRDDVRVVPIKIQVDKAVSTCMMHQEWEYLSRRSTPRMRSTIRTRPQMVPTYSYGGTFAVSKDLPPLPTPDPLREFSPRKRMYCTMANPYPILEGSGDFSRPKEMKTDPFSSASDLIFFHKSSVCAQYRVEIPEPRKIFSQSWLRRFQYFRKRSQSYGEQSAPVQETELNIKRDANTDVAEGSDTGDKNQVAKDMIVAYCKQGVGNPPISMQDCVYHQYCQQPCVKCGRTHYQQRTTINGTLCCSPTVCSAAKGEDSSPVQLIQIPCTNQNCPGGPQQVTQSPCGIPNCPNAHDKRSYVGSSSLSVKRNGLQPEYLPKVRYPYQESQECRRCRPQVYAEEPNDMCCVRECPRPPPKCAEQQPIIIPCRCCCAPGCVAAGTSTDENCYEQFKNCEVMAVQEMTDKNVQIKRNTIEDNPQTSETRMITAAFLNHMLEDNKSDRKPASKKSCLDNCSKSASKKSYLDYYSNAEESSEQDTTTEMEEPEQPPQPCQTRRESKDSKTSKISKASKMSKTSKISKTSKLSKMSKASKANSNRSRLTAGGPLLDSETSTGPSYDNIGHEAESPRAQAQPKVRMRTGSKESGTIAGSNKSKMSYRDAVRKEPSHHKGADAGVEMPAQAVVEPEIKKQYVKNHNVVNISNERSVCECLILGKPAKDCKRTRMRKTEPVVRGECENNHVAYRDIPHDQDLTDEAALETNYEEDEVDDDSSLDQPVEEPLFQKTRVPNRIVTQTSAIEETSLPEETEQEMEPEPEFIPEGKMNEEWCAKCCTEANAPKPKKKCWNIFKKKKK